MGAQIAGEKVAIGDKKGGKAGVAVGALVGDDNRFPDLRMFHQCGFDLAEFDAEPADLDLVVRAAQVL
ncbi:hypothetical protein N566_06895 [Streptomycetaceae bacterium MP113-05]|nr:hypothetical protein N566_06895 [Streptomycetaceae bacterium MP113-05]